MKLLNSKKGFSLVEIVAAIVIVGLASTYLTTMVITSLRGQVRAQQYLLAEEMAKTYDSILSRDIKKSNMQSMYIANANVFDPDDASVDKYKTVNSDFLNSLTKKDTDYDSDVWKMLYSSNSTVHLQLNGIIYDSSNVSIRIYVISPAFGYYKTQVTVRYTDNGRAVTYNGTHFSE